MRLFPLRALVAWAHLLVGALRSLFLDRPHWATPGNGKGIFAFAVAVRDPATKVAYDARRFSEAFLAVGDTDTGVVEVAWSAEQVE
jgi:hypothetical protein